MYSTQLLLLVRFQRKLPLKPSISALLPILLPVLLHMLPVLLLCPPLKTPTNAGTTATMEIKLNVAVPLAPGFLETN